MPDVGEAALLLELLLVVERPAVREEALLEAGDEHDREFEALRGVERDERHRVGVALVRILVGDEGGLLEQAIERVVGRQVVVAGRDRAQLEQVRPALLAVLRAVGQHRAVARRLEGLVEQLGEAQHADPGPQAAHQHRELGQGVARPRRQRRELAGDRGLDRAPRRPALARGGGAQRLDRLVADPARRDVDDPLEADAVGVRAQDAQVGQGVLDLAPGVEPGPADELVAEAVAQERFLDRPGLGVHPVHHRDVARPEALDLLVGPAGQGRAAAADQALDLAGDPLGLLLLVVGLEALDLRPAAVVGPQLLVLARAVARDHPVGGVEDQLGRAVVLLELDDGGVGPVALEVEDVAQVGAAPRVDRLVVVADHAQVAVAGGQRADPQVLRPVGVLVFVDVEVAPLLLVLGEDVGRLVEEPDRLEQEVVEVERVRLAQALLVARREAGDRPFAVVRGVLGQERRIEHLVLGPADGAQHDARAELAGQRHVLFAQDLLHQRGLVVGVVDDEPAADPDGLAVGAQHARGERVERAGHHVPPALADEADDPLAQLGGGPVREGDREDPPRGDVLDADQVGDPVGEDAGLARAGAGQDQQRAVGGRDGAGLLGVERPDDLVLALLERGGARGRVGRRDGRARILGLGRDIAHPGRFVGDLRRRR